MLSRKKRAEEARRRQIKILAHHRRVLAQRPMVDTTAPRSMSFKHMKVNRKKEQMRRERQLRIWKTNQTINESLVDIETRKGGEYTKRGPINKKSLRLRVRLEEVDKINRDNARLYRSILKSRSEGNSGSHAKYGIDPAQGWKHHDGECCVAVTSTVGFSATIMRPLVMCCSNDASCLVPVLKSCFLTVTPDRFEEFRRRLLELPQVKPPEARRPGTSHSTRRPATQQSGRRPGTQQSGRRPRTQQSGRRPATSGSRRRPAPRASHPDRQDRRGNSSQRADESDDEPF